MKYEEHDERIKLQNKSASFVKYLPLKLQIQCTCIMLITTSPVSGIVQSSHGTQNCNDKHCKNGCLQWMPINNGHLQGIIV